MLTTGEMICERRKQIGLKQCDLAKLVGVSKPMMCKIESDERKPSAKLMRKIMTVLGGFSYELDETYNTSTVNDRLVAYRMLEKRVDEAIYNMKVTKDIIRQLIEQERKEEKEKE